MKPSPAVLIITHNRFANVKNLLDKIIKSDDLRLYIAIDGPNKFDVKYKDFVNKYIPVSVILLDPLDELDALEEDITFGCGFARLFLAAANAAVPLI